MDEYILDQAGFEVRDWEEFWANMDLAAEQELDFNQ